MSTTSEPDPGLISDEFGIDAASIAELSRTWAPESRAAMLQYLQGAQHREQLRAQYKDSAALASAIDPDFIATPAVRLIARDLEHVLTKPRHNLSVSMPPQEGKSTMCAVWAVIRALQLNPNRKIILATYASSLAEDHSRECRRIIASHGSDVIDAMTNVAIEDKIGFQISATSNKVHSWQVSGARGGLVAVGLHGTITGRGADLFIVDDPYKDMQEADSPLQRENVDTWMRSVARTRLSPAASMILIQTRWHPEDLTGDIIKKEKKIPARFRTWKHINIPAVSQAGITDSLQRPPGVTMISARGRTAEDFEATKEDVGDRVWFALYQGSPRNPEGGLFKREWFEKSRVDEAPNRPVSTIVSIDPAETGKRDETGIMAASIGAAEGKMKVTLTHDWSGSFTSDQWGRRAVTLALTVGAHEIAMEAYTAETTYTSVLKRAWRELRKEAAEKSRAGLEALTDVERAALTDNMPFTIFGWRGEAKADSIARSALIRQAVETGTCRTIDGQLATFEDQACDWQAGQHQPDRLAAAVIVHDRLVKLAGGRLTLASPIRKGTPAAPAQRLRRSLKTG